MPDVIGLADDQFRSVLNRNDALFLRNRPAHHFGQAGLACPGRANKQASLPGVGQCLQEAGQVPGIEQIKQDAVACPPPFAPPGPLVPPADVE
jgi:hypothetical protein